MRRSVLVLSLLLTGCLSAQTVADKPLVHPLFADNCVVQRDAAFPVWGWAAPGTQVTVALAGKTGRATAGADGTWLAKLGPLAAGGPFELTVDGPQKLTIKNVLVGDVWICSGQSNMEMGIGAINAKADIDAANDPQLRLMMVGKRISYEPQELLSVQWSETTPQTVLQPGRGGWSGFSAVGYFFGKKLREELKVPIGLIGSYWGGTIAEAWVSAEKLSTMPDFEKAVANTKAKGAGLKDGSLPKETRQNPNQVTVLYNGMIAPLLPYGVKGAIWYQGESNAGRGDQYRRLLPTLAKDWRERFAGPDFGVKDQGFYCVSLANFMAVKPQPSESGWAVVREAQHYTAATLPNAGQAIAIDIGDAKDIHPKNKQEVGRRLALAALANSYGQKIEYSGPTFKSLKAEGDTLRLSFDHTTGGLVAKGEKLTGFAIKAAEGAYVWADASIDGNTIMVKAEGVKAPVAVRYAWADNPVCNLYNGAGLPAVPFRSDSPVLAELTAAK